MNEALMGFSEIDITPDYSVQTVGFGRADEWSKGILHRLKAQVTLWKSDDYLCCLAAIDHIGFMCTDANKLRDQIAGLLGIARDKVMLCFSHTHSAPNISLEQEYFSFLCQQVLLCASEAQKAMIPVKAAWGSVEAEIGENRRSRDGVLDRRIGVLKITDAATDRLKLLILRVTAHANVLLADNYLLSSDYFGVTRELLENKYGCKVMIAQGASGNVKPKYDGSVDALNRMAALISDAVSDCVDNMKPQSITNLAMFSQGQTFYADVPSMDRAKAIAEEAMRENFIDGSNWLQEVSRLHDEGIKRQANEMEVQYFRLNNGCLCGVPSEIMCELAVDACKVCQDDQLFFGGYTNGCDGYLPNAEEYDRGGYEVLHSWLIYYIYHGRVMPLNRDTAERLVAMVADCWKEIK